MKNKRQLWIAVSVGAFVSLLLILMAMEGQPSRITSVGSLFSDSASINAQQRREKETKVKIYRKVRLFNRFKFDYPKNLRRDRRGNYYVVDKNNHRVCVFDPSENFKFQIGQLGQGPEDLNHPGPLVLDSHGWLYVGDSDNFRIQIFDRSGRRVGGFHSPLISPDLVVNSRGEIFLNHPTRGRLISVYSSEGKLLRQFGDLMNMSHAYPGHPDDEKYQVPLSRVVMDIDEGDNLYVAYLFAPIIQKYDAVGNLLWERSLKGPLIEVLIRSFWQMLKPDPAMEAFEAETTMNIDGVQMAVICNDIAVNAKTGQIFILLGAADIIYVADGVGEKLGLLRQKKIESGSLWTLTSSDGILYATDTSSCYRLLIAHSFRR